MVVLKGLIGRFRPRQESEPYENLTEEQLKRLFVEKVAGFWQRLPSLRTRSSSGDSHLHYCELRNIDWRKVDPQLIRFLPSSDKFGHKRITAVRVDCWVNSESNSAQLNLKFGWPIFKPFSLSFSILNGKDFYATSEEAFTIGLGQIFHGAEVVKLGGEEPSVKKALELACLTAEFVQNALGGKIPHQLLPKMDKYANVE